MRSRVGLALIVLLVPVMAGCVDDRSDDDPAEAPPVAPIPAGLFLHDSTGLLDPAALAARDPMFHALANLTVDWRSVAEMDGREPTVAVDSEGTLYYAARDYSGGNTPPLSATQTPVMRSTDGGLTWEDVSPRLPTGDREPPRSGDPMIVSDPWTDRIFQIELYDLVCNWIVFTDDGGESWTSNPKACSSLVVDHQTIGAGPSATGMELPIYPNMVYVCVNQIADAHCSRSTNGGLTFETFHLVYPGTTPWGCVAGGIHGHVLVDPSGTVYLPREYCGRPYVAVSKDDGLTWALVDVTGGNGLGASDQDPNMAFDDAGNVYYLFIGEDELPYLSWSDDQGSTWSDPVRVSPPNITAANHPSITAGSDGRIGFEFTGTTHPEPPIDGGEAPWNSVTWDAYMGISIDATAEDPLFAVRKVNPDGDIVYRGDCTHQRCGFMREFMDASIAPDGRFYAALIDACLRPDEPRARTQTDCNSEIDDYGEGNGHLAYLGVMTGGPPLWTDQGPVQADIRSG